MLFSKENCTDHQFILKLLHNALNVVHINLIVTWAIVLMFNSLKVAHVNFIIKWAIIKVLKYFHVSTYHTTDTAWHSCSSYTHCNVFMGVIVCSISCNDTLVASLMTYQHAGTSLDIAMAFEKSQSFIRLCIISFLCLRNIIVVINV